MKPNLLPIIYNILSEFQSDFNKRTFTYFLAFVFGFIKYQTRYCVTQIYLSSGYDCHYSNFHRFLSHYKWELLNVQKRLVIILFTILKQLYGEDLQLTLVGDDTKIEKSGKKQHGVHAHFDHTMKAGKGGYINGHCWVVLGLVSRFGKQVRYFPLRAVLYIRKKFCSTDIKFQTKIEQMSEEIDRISKWLSMSFLVLVDSFYGGKKTFIKKLVKQGHHIISRLRWDSALFKPYEGSREKKRGRPRVYGDRIDIWSLFKKASLLKVFTYGQEHQVSINEGTGLLRGWGLLIKWVVIWQDKDKYILLFSTDLSMSSKEIIEWYAIRWKIELNFRDSKQNMGLTDYQVRSCLSISRYVNISLLSTTVMTLVGLIIECYKSFKMSYPWYKPTYMTIGFIKIIINKELQYCGIKSTLDSFSENLKNPKFLINKSIATRFYAKL